MSIKKKLLIALAVICFIAALAGVFLDYKWVSASGLLIFAMCMLLIVKNNTDEEDKYELELMEQFNADMEESRKKIKELEGQVLKFKQYVKHVRNANEEESLKQGIRIKKLKVALKKEKEKQAASDAITYKDFLPACDAQEERQLVDILKSAREVVDEMKDFLEMSNLTVQINAMEESIMVNANQERLRIMFRNIVDNCIKYMKRSGGVFMIFGKLDKDVLIVIKDNGEGLSQEETNHIFEMNYQGSNRVNGNGLGLTQSKAIVEYYGGTIHAKSTSGNGMAIFIQFPLSEVQDVSAGEIIGPTEIPEIDNDK